MSIASLYPSINPSLLLDFANVKRLDPRITFTRTTTATYYDGVTTAKAEQNLLTYSQEFDNAAWTKSNTTVTANSTAAPDGTTTAETLASSNSSIATTGVYVYLGSSGITVGSTLSCYAKANTSSIAWVAAVGSSTAYAVYNLSTQTLIASANCTASLVSVGNSWYRIVLSNITVASDNFIVGGKDSYSSGTPWANGTWTSGNSIYIWGAQLEQRSSVTAYTATTSQAITNYIPVLQTASAGQARFDHNPTTGESLGLLIEEARTNVMTYSEDFSAWSLGAATVTSNTVVSPNGSINGDLIASTGTTDSHDVFLAQTTGATAITASVYVKNRSGQYIYVALSNTANGTDYSTVSFDITNGTYGTVNTAGNFTGGSASITSVGNSWYRVSITATSNASSNYVFIGISSGLNPSYVPRGRVQTTNTNSFFAWGAQLEAGSFATSYIPTTGSTATRNADAASMTGTNFSSWFNAGEGTFYGEANLSGGGRYFHTAKTGSNAQIEGSQQTAYFEAFVYTTDVQAQINITAASFINRRVALAYQVNNIAACVSGGAVSVDTNAILPLDLNAFYVNSYGTSGPLGSGTFKKVAYYPKRLTNAQLQALTV